LVYQRLGGLIGGRLAGLQAMADRFGVGGGGNEAEEDDYDTEDHPVALGVRVADGELGGFVVHVRGEGRS